MINLMQNASDDQTALIGCMLTLCAAAFVVFLSFHAGPAGQKVRRRKRINLNLNMQSEVPIEAEQHHERAA